MNIRYDERHEQDWRKSRQEELSQSSVTFLDGIILEKPQIGAAHQPTKKGQSAYQNKTHRHQEIDAHCYFPRAEPPQAPKYAGSGRQNSPGHEIAVADEKNGQASNVK